MPGTPIAVIQMEVKPMDPEANLAKASTYIRSAAQEGAKLAILPEWHLTHFVNRKKIEQFDALAGQWPQYLSRYCDLARECSINIVPGTFYQKTEDKYLNTAFFISDEGKVLGSYSKKNLWGVQEKAVTQPGRGPNKVMDTSIGKVGLLICYDVVMPQAFSELLVQGAEWVIVPGHMRGFDGYPDLQDINSNANAIMLKSCILAQAYMNNCAVIFANAGGSPKRGYTLRSQISLPIVGTVARTAGPEEQMRIVNVELDTLRHAERMYGFANDFQKRLVPDAEYPFVAPTSEPSNLMQKRDSQNEGEWGPLVKSRL